MEGYRIKCPECGSVIVEPNESAATTEDGELLGYDYDPECKMCGSYVDETWIPISEVEYLQAIIMIICEKWIQSVGDPYIQSLVDKDIIRYKKLAGIKE